MLTSGFTILGDRLHKNVIPQKSRGFLYSAGTALALFMLWAIFSGITDKLPPAGFLLSGILYLILSILFVFQFSKFRSFTGYLLIPFFLTWATWSNFNDKSLDFVMTRFPRIFWLTIAAAAIDFSFRFLLGTIHKGTKWATGIISALLQTALVMFPVAVLFRNLVDGSLLIPSEIEAIYQTNFPEAFYFISSSPACLLSLGFFLGFLGIKLYWNLSARPSGISSASWKKRIPAIMICILAGAGMGHTLSRKTDRLLLYKLSIESRQYFSELRHFNEIAARRRFSRLNPVLAGKIQTCGKPVRLVLILGESQNRNYMSAYGYRKKTTPWFDSIRKSDRFHIFKKACSCHTVTVPVLRLLFTSLNQYEHRKFRFDRAITLFDILRHAGFKTRWFSNQHKMGKFSSPIAVLSSSTDYSRYTTTRLSDINDDSAGCDTVLLPFADRLPAGKKSFTVFHLFGCHYPYRMRFPDGYLRNKPWTDYERSMHFNDQTVGQLVQRLREKGVDVIVFLSDHSEIPEGRIYHQPSRFRPAMAEIPMFVYVSPKYKKNNPEIVSRIARAKKRLFTNDLTFNLLLTLMHIRQEFNSPQLDVLNDAYMINAANARTLYGTRKISSRNSILK